MKQGPVSNTKLERRRKAAEDLRLAREAGGLIDDQAAACALGVSRPTWWRIWPRYGLRPIRVGRATRWRASDVDALVERLAEGQGVHHARS